MGKTKRILTVVSVVAAAGVMPLLTATSASASQSSCANYVGSHGYLVGPKVKGACSNAAIDTGAGKQVNPWCVYDLVQAGVTNSVALGACIRA